MAEVGADTGTADRRIARLKRLLWPKERWRRACVCLLAVLAPIALADLIFPPPMERARHVSTVVTARDGAVLRAFPVEDGKWRLQANIETLDPAFVRALLAYEDKRFFAHSGVDPIAMVRAALSSASAGRVVSGGSTITMQTARLLEPRPRNVGSKLIESFRAMQLDWRYSKDEILELYLTLAPYGGNLEGVRAASWAYFGREPSNLSPDQIAMLIALPQSPEARRPDLRPDTAIAARKRVLDRLAGEGVFAADLAAESAEYPAPSRRDFPTLAWHAAETARALGGRNQGDIATTLNYPLQMQAEALAARARSQFVDGSQVALLVVDIGTRDVLASVGAADRQAPGGWIDLTNRKRSPGSTLKPFIYGLAFDDGIAAPATRIQDAPRRFASYRPDNFDRMFLGDVTVAEALQHSLNVPAVAALDAIGPRRFLSSLEFAGAHPSLPVSAEYDDGLAVALGGVGLTARDLAVLYAALGDGGKARPLNWLADRPKRKKPERPLTIMTPESASEIIDILRRAPTPQGRMPARLTQQAPEIAFKTGTSYGYRDAWAAGVGDGLAIVVWTGRADSAPRTATTGREDALPILFEAFDLAARILPKTASGPVLRHDLRDRPTPRPMASFESDARPPQILFPPTEAELWVDERHRSFVMAAEGRGRLDWYVEGRPLGRNAAGEAVWFPETPGFYKIAVVDADGRTTRSSVRVRTPEQ